MPSVSLAALNKSLPDNTFQFVVQQWSEFIEVSMIIIRLQKLTLCQHAGKKLNVLLESNFRLGITCCCVRGTSARAKTSVTSPPTGIPHLRLVMGLVWGTLSILLVQDIRWAGPQGDEGTVPNSFWPDLSFFKILCEHLHLVTIRWDAVSLLTQSDLLGLISKLLRTLGEFIFGVSEESVV